MPQTLRALPRLTLSLSLLLAACSAVPPASFPGARQQATSERASAAAQRGEHELAAGMYETLARRAAEAERSGMLLSAAQQWVLASRPAEATRILNGLPQSLAAEQATWRRILQADVTHANGQSQQAWQALSGIAAPAGALSPYYYDARMRIALAAARPVDAVRAEIAAEQAAADAIGRTQLRTRLLALLRDARDRGVKLEPAASQDTVVKGWLDLGAISSATRGASLTGGAEAIRWRARYPGHPATELLSQALPAALTSTGTVTRIGLLLPLSRTDAQVVRDGFRFALAQLPANARPELALYDTSNASVTDLLAQARADGSDFIAGPLTREEVAAAAAFGTPLAPTLALNFLANERDAPASFYQYALSPEDEARSVARRVLASGQKRGVALAPTGDWGNRVLAAFTQELQAGGGILLSQASYDPATHDYGVPIKVVLGTVESDARARRLQSLLNTRLEYEPRRRGDIQFIFAAGMSTQARLLRPQLRFNYAGTVPIYATSAAFAAEAGDSNRDLDGLQFPDMPWMLPDASIDALRNSAQQAGISAAWRTRLFAFGYDAGQLTLAIAGAGRDLRRVQVAGMTGTLTLDENGRVRRELQWARIRDGEPLLLGNPVPAN